MNIFRSFFLFHLFLSLSANVYSQIDYDSIALELGYLLEENFAYDEIDLFEDKFNNEVFKSFINLKEPDGNENVEEFNSNFTQENFGKLMFERIQTFTTSESSYKFINYSIDELKNIYIILRLYSDDGGINYHQYLFEPSGVGSYRITDVYFFLNGEYFSQTLETHYYNTLEKLINAEEGNEGSEFKSLFALARIRRLIDAGNLKKARKIFFRDIEEEERKKKDYIFLEIELTDPDDEEAYKDLTERLLNFAEEGNPSFYLSAIDFYYMDEKYEKVIEVVDSLYSFTGDSFLEVYKANSYIELGDFESAEKSLIIANDDHPEMMTTYDLLFYFYELQNEIPKFLNVLDTMGKYLNIDYKYFKQTVPQEYPSIANTENYKNWIAERLDSRKIKADSLGSLLLGEWEFVGSEDFEGQEIETSPYWEETYGNNRPDITFTEGWNFISDFESEIHMKGIWDFDFGHQTLDLFVPFNEKSQDGKAIIEGGYFEVIDGKYYETTSYYYLSIAADTFKLFDPQHGLNVYKKAK